jgi:hypothetical protein
LNDEALYRNLDRLHPQRALIEGELAAREKELFALPESIYLYDLTSTYFEGKALRNEKAKRGYSRDQRPDCKQVVVGLVLDADGFPKAHEVFDGNRNDSTTVDDMLAALEKRFGKKAAVTVTVDRGMAYDKNIEQIRGRGYHYLVAAQPRERWQHEQEFVEESGWEEIVRQPSPTNPCQHKTQVSLKQCLVGEEVHVLCLSEQRKEKDRAIREQQEKRLLADLEILSRGIAKRNVRGGGRGYQNGGPPFTNLSPRLSLFSDHLRTVLAVKGSLRRAQQWRALDGSGPFRTTLLRRGKGSLRTAPLAGDHFAAILVPFFVATDTHFFFSFELCYQ